MFQLRRTALRLLSKGPAATLSRPRSITTVSIKPLRITQRVSQPIFQRRWATDEAIREAEPALENEIENAAEVLEEVERDAEETISDSTSATEASPVPSESLSQDQGSEQGALEPTSTIYVGNLFFDVTEKDIQLEFERFGQIERVNLIRDARGLSRGFGYIHFNAHDAARAAIDNANQTLFEGRRITVQLARKNLPTLRRNTLNPPTKTLFIGNMSFEMTDRDLNDLFKGIRNIIDVRVAIDRRTGQPRGFAHADFIDEISAIEAQKILSAKTVYGRKLRVDFGLNSARNSAKGAQNESNPSDAAAAADNANPQV